MKRRDLLKTGVIGTGLGLAIPTVTALDKPLQKTPRDAEGPFYPVEPRDQDTPDLLRNMVEPHGKILKLKGTVLKTDGSPLFGRVIDIWQTDPLGRYRHPNDRTEGKRFEDFAYFGKAVTDAKGEFTFRTYIPGGYGGRPAHIHYIVWNGATRELTSQIYFKGLNKGTGPIIASRHHDLRQANLHEQSDGTYKTDFRIVI